MNQETLKKMKAALETLESADEATRWINGLFKYDTLDEAKSGKGRLRSAVTFEIGGPCAHLVGGIRTRKEHTMLKTVLLKIYSDRRIVAEGLIAAMAPHLTSAASKTAVE